MITTEADEEYGCFIYKCPVKDCMTILKENLLRIILGDKAFDRYLRDALERRSFSYKALIPHCCLLCKNYNDLLRVCKIDFHMLCQKCLTEYC